MTAESPSPGTIAPLPVWIYWTCVALCTGVPVLYVAGVVPPPYDAILAAVNAALGALIGVSRPVPTAEKRRNALKL